MSKVYCTAPWNGITVRENGDVKTCCAGSTILGNLHNESISDIIKSPKLIQIQNNLLANGNDINCKGCVSLEKDSGVAALRQYYLNSYPNIYKELQFKNLDIRWNNLCNLSCVYCTPTNSSVWQSKLNIKVNRPIKEYQDELLKFILDKADQVDEIMLAGGEPMLMKQNHQLIQQLPDSTKISIITNMSYDLESLPCIDHLIKRPRENTVWNISLENTQKQFEYVRNGAEWSQVKKNIDFLNQFWGGDISVLMVYSMLNAFDVDAVVSELHNFNIKKINFQPYFGNSAFNVFNMPVSIQSQALNVLQKAKNIHYENIHPDDWDFFPMHNVDFFINQLGLNKTPSSPTTRQQFYSRVEWCNQWTKHNFRDLWPHVIDLVDHCLD